MKKKAVLEIITHLPVKQQRAWDKLIVSVLQGFPNDIGEHLVRDCLIVMQNKNSLGMFVHTSRKKIIILNLGLMARKKISTKVKKLIICHEFTHAFLNSPSEKKVYNQMVEWGFIPNEKR